jgi:hypothetical protein
MVNIPEKYQLFLNETFVFYNIICPRFDKDLVVIHCYEQYDSTLQDFNGNNDVV